ncbi:MAG: T9SS type A sorting domain-containing protein [Chlorobi bacterium]|nr:T9SS type A sorting domain-containing protein [Chlorobiota bacterium]
MLVIKKTFVNNLKVHKIKSLVVLSLILLLCNFTLQSQTYYSQGTGNFTTLANWNTNPGGGGSSPAALADLQNGLNNFVIQDAHVVSINDSININNLTIGGGTSGTLTFGIDAVARQLVINGTTTINAGGILNIGAYTATHTIYIKGAITNNGTFDLQNSSSQVANAIIDGTFSISGNSPQFNNITFNSGTITAGVSFDIEGNVTIETGATFADGGFTHTVAGDWTENGTGQMTGTGTIQMDATLVQSIKTAATFNNLTFSGGSIATISGANNENILTVNGNLYITNNTEVSTSSRHTVAGNFTVDEGSKYAANDGRITFNSASAQTITVSSTTNFDEVYFDNGGAAANPKTIVGNYRANDLTRVYPDAVIDGTGSQRIQELRLDGECNFSGTITFTGGTIWENLADSSLALGTAKIYINGSCNIQSGDTVKVNNDFVIQYGHLVINLNSVLKQNSANKTFTLIAGKILYIRGVDNFPSGFNNYVLESSSQVRYDRPFDQVVRGNITYPNLFIYYNTKTVDGAINVINNLYLRNSCILNLSSFNHSFTKRIDNGSNASITSTGTVTLDAADADQIVETAGTGSYTFNNLIITSSATSAVRTKHFYDNIIVNGNFTITNTGGSAANYIILDIDDFSITNDGGDTFTMGSNVELRTSGATSYETSMSSFATISIDASDVIRFDGTAQNIPGGFTYPNVEFQGDGNKTATGALDINGDVTRNANTPVFVDGGFSHTVAGDWNMGTAYTSMTGTVTFDGTAQNISASNFANVVFSGSGTKTLDGNIDISGDLTIDASVTLNAATRNINIEGNWSNLSGIFTQTTGTTTFDGTQNSKTITSNSSSYFGNLVINKTGGDKTITANTDIDADLDFDLTASNAVFDLNGNTIYIGRDFDYNTGTTFTHNNGTVVFDGASTDQLIRLYNASNQFYNVEFKNAGVKRVYDNDMDINGNVTIYSGATLRTSDNNRSITVQGNWTNSGNFQSNRSVTFDGADQTIGASDFHDLYIDGIAKNLTETKTLGGNITLSGELHIQDGVTLDVSANNYSILVEERWYNDDGTNTGVFNPRQGTVTFNGAAQGNLYTGGSGSGKQFYNLTVNLTASQVILYTYDLRVQNDLYVQNGEFDPNNLDVFIGGSLINEGTFTYRASSLVTLEATSGTHQLKGGSASFGDMTIDALGATYTLESDLTFNTTRYRTLILNNGYLDLNSYDIDLLARDGHIDINGGTFEVDSAAIVTLGRDGYYTNDGGVFMIVGNSGADATLTSNQTTTTDYFTFIQNTGTFHAKYYHVEKIQGNGIEIAGGTIDATNNFSEGNFNNGYGPAGAYITISGIDLGAGITATNVSFNSGPANNVKRLSGNGAITFENSSGDFTGAVYESDGGSLINWTFPGGFFWDDGGGDNDWNNALNWGGNTRPTSSSNVFLEHTNGGLASTYTVNINAADAVCNRLTIDPEGGNPITLVLNGYELQVNENVDIKASATLTQTNATDTVFVAGSWSNAGTFNENNSVVVFNGSTGTSSISTGGSSDSFYDLQIDADGATYIFNSAIDILNDLNLKAGTLSAGTNNLTIDGNWNNNGGTFDPGTAKVTFQGAAQNISGGNFYDFYTGGTGTKTLTGNIDVGRDVRIQAGTVLDGASKIIYVTRNWRNDVGDAGFTQTGIGSVFFDGANQNVGNSGTVNTFNNVYFQGTGTKTVSQNMTVNGDMYIKSGINRVTLQSAVTVTGAGASNTLNQTGGELRLEGVNNFPTGFENINLSAGNVRYYSNSDQSIYSTTYYGLILQRQNSGKPNKTLLGDISATTITLNDNQATMDVAGYSITLTGNFSYGSGNAITWNNGTLIHEGAGWNIDADFTEFHNLTLKGSGTKRMFGNLTITGDVSIQSSGVTLRMDTYTMNCTGLSKSFTMNAGTYLTCGLIDPTVAFPSGFSSYSLDPTSRVTLNGAGNQIINCSFTYGELYLRNSGNATMNAALDVDGNFDMNNSPTLVDGGFDLTLAGAIIDMRTYTPGANTITFDGTDQIIRNETGANPDNMYFNNVVFAGSGTKTMNQNDQYNISGTVTINSGVTVDSDEDWMFSGSTFTNNGTFDNTGGNFTMNGSSGQSIDPGAANIFNNITFTNGGGNKTVVNNGMDINGTFTINSGATLDMGAVTHTISSTTITNSGVWITTNANLTFDRNGGQTIPALTAKDIICTTGGTKTLSGNWSIDDLTIETPARLDVGDGLDYSITLTGSWSNTGTFYDRNGTITFESSDAVTKTIDNNGNNFWKVLFNQSQTNSRTYTINDDFRIADSLAIGNGATVDLNGHILILGDNDTPDQIETHTIDAGGELQVDAGATLQFNSVDGSSVLNVAGTLSVVGVSGNIATVTNETSNTGRRIDINITTGTIAARYYHFRYMVNTGMDVQATATIDATNNFSDGSWSDISTSNSGTYRYLILDAPATVASINNVTFNHGGTPVVGVHYNVQRVSTADVVTFGGTINGELAGDTYEDDAGNKITWPVITTKTWDGSASTDWHTAANWTPAGVPNSSSDVVIPSASNNPIINTSNASVKSLQISTGTLTIDAGYDLSVAEDIVIGTSTNAGILAIGNSGSTITVGGSWTRGSNGVFINGSSTVTFNAGSGNVNIDPDDDSFYNIIFNGGATFNLYASAPGAIFDVDGSFTISSGTVTPSTNNYVLTIGGDLTNSGGSFITSTNGTIELDGTGAQAITTMTFDNLTVGGSGTKTFNGANVIQDALQVNSTLTVATGGSLDMNDNVTIDAAGTFNDGGESHTFSGTMWTGSGTYTGSGTITFDGGNQDIYASTFNNVIFNGTGNIELYGDVDISGDVTIYNTINQFYCYTYLINNTSGTGTFTLENGEYIRVRGANNFPSNFATYSLGETSYTYYDGTIDQAIAGITYGRLYLSNNTTKTLAGNIDVNERLYINDATLDVSTSNYKINIADNWYNNTSGTFVQRSGEIIFDGTANQNISLGTTGTNDFYKVTVNKSSGTVNVQNTSLTIEDNLRVLSGTFSANGQTVNVGGNITVTSGTIAQSGTFNLNKSSGSATIQANSSSFNNLTINSGATYTLQDNLSVANNFTLTSGIFDGNGNTVELGNNLDVVSISGTYKIGAGGYLKLGQNVSLTVNSGGVIYVVGSAGNYAYVTNRSGTTRYNFSINGTIHALYYEFDYMNSSGISISSSGTIDGTNNFSYGTFANPISAGTCLKIENTQSFTNASRINDVNFPDNPGGGATNVTKGTAVSGTLEFYNATGSFSGSTFENDPNGLINWTGPVTLTWTGATSSDWNTVGNWSASSGPDKVPTGSEDVVIASALNQPEITTTSDTCKSLVINSGAFVSINSSDATSDLVVMGNLEIKGTLSMNSSNDKIEVGGDWYLNGGLFTNGQGIVEMNSTTGSQSLNCGTTPFYDLIINSVGTVDISATLNITNDLTITTGTLDVTATDYTVNVGGNFVNTGTFNAQNGKLVLKSTAAATKTFNPGSSSFYNLSIEGGASTIYQLTTNNLTVNEGLIVLSGTFDLNSLTLNLGDGSGTDDINIEGTMIVDENAFLKLKSGASVFVNSGGIFKAVGLDDLNVATITNQGSGTYSFSVNSGGTIHANYYQVEYVNATGIWIKSGASIDEGTNNFSNGTWSNGTSGGRYLLLENNFTGNFTASNLYFNTGPSVNIKRITGTGNITINDGFGAIAGEIYEEDDGSAITGLVRWSYTNPLYTWNGGTTDWNTATNWDISGSGNGVPNSTSNVVIPNTGTDPVLNSVDGSALSININSGATLTIDANHNLTVDGSLTNNGTLTIANGSSSTITVLDTWSNSGTFNPGDASTIELTANTGTKNITTGGSTFFNLLVNSGGAGTATFTTLSSLDINGDLTLQSGTLEVTDPSHTISVAGNWTNTGGSFTNGSSSVTFDGAAQTISSVGTETFYDVTFSGTNTKTLTANIIVNNDLTISSTLNISNGQTIEVKGSWNNTGILSHAGTSTVSFTGTTTQSITNSGGTTFNSLTINNTSSTFPQILLSDAITVTGTLTLTDGIVQTSIIDLLTLSSTGSLSGGTTSASYIDGPMGRNGTSNFTFPIGAGTVFARLGVSGMSASANLVAQYYDASYTDTLSFGTGVRNVSEIEYWDLSRTSGTGNPFVSIYWEDGNRSVITDPSTLLVVHYTGGKWVDMGGSITGTQASGHVSSTTQFSSFSPITIGDGTSGSNPLPVELVDFDAKIDSDVVKLNWVTLTEENNDYFTVERSEDGVFFEPIGQIEGAGNSNELLRYELTDENPYSGTSYYRLKQTDYNGEFSYSKMVNVNIQTEKENAIIQNIQLYPNPATNFINVSGTGYESFAEIELIILNNTGSAVRNIWFIADETGAFNRQIELNSLKQGMYFVTIVANQFIQNKQIIIK